MNDAIAAIDLSRRYGNRMAVANLSFTVAWGRVTAFLGPNGAGKTTTMRMILGLVAPTSGSALLMGRPYRELTSPATTVGAVLDGAQFHPLRTARSHLRIQATIAGLERRRVDEVLDLVELGHAADQQVRSFSLGMRQRLGIAGALLGDPAVLVLDEPANGLDPSGVRWLRSLLRALAAEGRAVFVSSHLLDEVTHVADDVVVINDGTLIVTSDLHGLLDTRAAVRVRTPQPERLRDLVAGPGVRVELVGHEDLVVRGMRSEDVGLVAAGAGIPVTRLSTDDGALEELFLELTNRGG